MIVSRYFENTSGPRTKDYRITIDSELCTVEIVWGYTDEERIVERGNFATTRETYDFLNVKTGRRKSRGYTMISETNETSPTELSTPVPKEFKMDIEEMMVAERLSS